MKHFVIPLTPSERERGKVGESESERVRETETEMERRRACECVRESVSQPNPQLYQLPIGCDGKSV